MALVKANDLDVVEARISLPRIGVWHVDAKIDGADDAIADGDAVEVVIGDAALTLKGTAARAETYLGALQVRVVAGVNGFEKTVAAKSYQKATVKIVLDDILRAAGEARSSTTDAAVLATELVRWTVGEQPAGAALRALLEAAPDASAWRMLPDGTLWAGAETWPASTVSAVVLARHPREARLELGVESPTLLPGTTLDGEKIDRVEHVITADAIRTTAWLADPEARMTAGFAGLYGRLAGHHVAGPVDYCAMYRAKVAAQSSDFRFVDLTPDNPKIPGVGNVPFKLGLPCATAQIQAGAYVLLGWEGGDPSKPYAVPAWEGGESIVKMVLGMVSGAGGALIILGGETGAEWGVLGQSLLTRLEDLEDKFNAHTHPVSGVQAGAASVTSAVTGTPHAKTPAFLANYVKLA